jgi:glycosyltransferase involved in cell wall biosynthesis
MRGVMPGITADDLVLLWAGGIWQWLDPLTVIRAVAAASDEIKNLRLVFLGTEDPNPQNRPMPMVEQSRQLASELGVLDRHVFFRPGWTSYEERGNWLLEADIGVSAHQETAEARFAFRTRVLDYIWAGLPMILTCGDYFSDWAERQDVGHAVAAGDVAGWQSAITGLAREKQEGEGMRARLLRLAPQFTWEKVAAPLARYCAAPYKTARVPGWRRWAIPFLAAVYDFTRGRVR